MTRFLRAVTGTSWLVTGCLLSGVLFELAAAGAVSALHLTGPFVTTAYFVCGTFNGGVAALVGWTVGGAMK